MTRLKWGEGPRLYDQGVDHGVLYLDNTTAPWNGLIAVDEHLTGSVNTEHYFDGNRMHISQETGDFEANVSAYTYPDAFAEYNGYSAQDTFKRFGFSYRTQHGDVDQLHLVYNVLVRNDTRAWQTVSDRPNLSVFNWSIGAAAMSVPGASPAAHLTMEVSDDTTFNDLEDVLYGTEFTEPRLPGPAEIIELYELASTLRVTYNGDGSYTVTGPGAMVIDHFDGSFDISSPSAHLIDLDTLTVSSN